MKDAEYQQRVAELDAYRQNIEGIRDQIRGTDSGNKRLATAITFLVGLGAGIAGSYFVAGDQVTNVVFCEQDAART